MNILEVPFHQFLHIEESQDSNFIFKIQERPQFLNHLGTIHACVQLSLAEATSGEYLLKQFYELKDDVIPVIRKTEVKYQKPANGTLVSIATFSKVNKEDIYNDLTKKNRAIVPIKVELFNEADSKTLSAVFDWFVAKKQ